MPWPGLGSIRLSAAFRVCAGAAALVLALGCAIHKAQAAYDEGRYEEALAQYSRILDHKPTDIRARIGYRRTAPQVAELHLQRAKKARKAGRELEEQKEVAAAVLLDPANAVAADWMNRLEQAAARKRALAAEQSVEAIRTEREARPVLPINPRSLEGMDLNFSRKTSLKEIFQQLSRNSGVNIVLHSSVANQDAQISIDLRGLTFQKVLDTLMLQNDLFYKVLDPNTIMLFKKTPQNLAEYENRLIKTFYLSNADIDNVRQIFNAIMPQVRVFPDKRMNALTLQARGNDLAVAQHIVTQLDKPKAEVMIYLELLEVSANARERVGLVPTTNLDPSAVDAPGIYRIGAAPSSANLPALPGIGQTQRQIWGTKLNFLFPGLALDALKTSGEGKLLASPNVRVVSGDTGEINIGEKITTTQSSIQGLGQNSTGGTTGSAPGTLGGALASQTQYAYEDTGVSIKVKPRVHFNQDITVELEATVKTDLGGTPGRPNIGQRIIMTTARLQDGETAVFGGLLKEEEVKTLQGIWGISDVPVLRSLLGHTTSRKVRTDVILTMRAVVVRGPSLQGEDFDAFDPDQAPNVAKPFAPKAQPGTPTPAPPAPPPAGAKDPAAPKVGETPGPSATSSLGFYLAPLTTEADPGQPVTLQLTGRGTKGLTDGTLSLQVDPRLKVLGIRAGDLASGPAASFQAVAGGGAGQYTLTFHSPGLADDGTLAVLDLQAVDPGQATVMIQDPILKAGSNPLTGTFVNALVSID